MNDLQIVRSLCSNLKTFYTNYSIGIPAKLEHVEIRLNWKCNAQCQMCGLHRYMERQSSERRYECSFDEWTQAISNMKQLGCSSITFSGGEPTLREDLIKLIEFAAKQCHMTVCLNTNGYLLNEQKIDKLAKAGLSAITFSILSPIASVNDEIMGLNKGFEKAVSAIDYIKNNTNMKVFVNTVILRNNIETLKYYDEMANKYTIDHIAFTPTSIKTPWDEWSCENDDIRPLLNQVHEFKTKTLLHLRKNKSLKNIQDPFGNCDIEINKNLHTEFSNIPKNCFVPAFHSVVQSNGDVIPCCYAPDNYIMGNICNNSFQSIWNGSLYKSFRMKIRKNLEDMCKSCREYSQINEIIMKKVDFMKMNSIELTIRKLICDKLKLDISPEELENSVVFGSGYGFDSTTLLEFILDLEEEFDILIPDEELIPDNFETISEIVSFIKKLTDKEG